MSVADIYRNRGTNALAVKKSPSTTNLCSNPEMESNITGWQSTGATLSQETVAPLVGTGSLKVVAAASTSLTYMQFVGLTIGSTYLWSALIKSTAAAGQKVAAQIQTGGTAAGDALDCNTTAKRVSMSFTATATECYPFFFITPDYTVGESYLLDSAAMYNLSA
jgi:hypothetical protein